MKPKRIAVSYLATDRPTNQLSDRRFHSITSVIYIWFCHTIWEDLMPFSCCCISLLHSYTWQTHTNTLIPFLSRFVSWSQFVQTSICIKYKLLYIVILGLTYTINICINKYICVYICSKHTNIKYINARTNIFNMILKERKKNTQNSM